MVSFIGAIIRFIDQLCKDHVRIKELLEERGRTKYWLNKRTDIDYKALSRLMNDETASIHFETIERLCSVLECTPNELFDIRPTEIK